MDITKQVEKLKDLALFLGMNGNSYTADLIKNAADTIERLEKGYNTIYYTPTDSSTGGWIPVSERLPEAGENILICDIYGDIYLTHRVKDGNNLRFYDETGNKIKCIRAWMPLPEPYKESEGKE